MQLERSFNKPNNKNLEIPEALERKGQIPCYVAHFSCYNLRVRLGPVEQSKYTTEKVTVHTESELPHFVNIQCPLCENGKNFENNLCILADQNKAYDFAAPSNLG